MSIVKAETNVTGAVSFGGMISLLKLRANGGNATVTINLQTFTVYLNDEWLELPVDIKSMSVDSGNVDYIAFG